MSKRHPIISVESPRPRRGPRTAEGAHAGDASPPPRLSCAPLETTIQFPTPYWERMTPEGLRLAAPPGDALAQITTLERPQWIGELGEIDGLAARPTFFIALDGPAVSADKGPAVLIAGGASPSALAVPLEARLDDDAKVTLIVRPRDPLPALDATTPLVLGLRPGERGWGDRGMIGRHPDEAASATLGPVTPIA